MRIGWLLLAVGLGSWGAIARAADLDEENILVLEVTVERFRASQGMVAYEAGDEVLLPLGEMAAALELAIDVDPAARRATGWVVAEDRPFALELDQGRVEIDGHQQGVPPGSVHVDDVDIYVASEVLSQWLPATFEVDLRGMRVDVVPRETLPLVARLKRDKLRSQMLARRPGSVLYPQRKADYRLVSWPFLDAEVGYDHDRAGDQFRGSVLSRGDLARLSVTGFLSRRQGLDDDTQAWLRAGRTDPAGELLGPLRATRFEVGDIFTGRIPFVSNGKRGRGAMVTNRRLGSSRSFDTTDLFGEAPPGWEVELFVNGNLWDFATVGASGQYEFTDVPIYTGTNVIRTVLYGPQGQTREEMQSLYVGPGMWRQGEVYYDAFSLQDELSIFGGNLWNSATADEGQWNHHLEVGYGLSRSFSLGTSVNRVSHEGRPQDVAAITAYKSLGPLYLQTILAKDLDAGHALRIAGQGRLLRQNVYLEQNLFQDFSSEDDVANADATSETSVRVSGNAAPLMYQLRYQHRSFDRPKLSEAVQYQARLSASVRGLMLGHEIELRRNSWDGGHTTYGSGSQLISGYWGDWRIKGDVGYGLSRNAGLLVAGATVQWRVDPRLNAQISGHRYFQVSPYTRVDANLTWTLDRLLAGLAAGYDTQGSWSVGVSVATSLTRAPGTGEWIVSGTKSAGYGAALARTFVDLDGDGRFGEGDEPLPGVTFRRNRRWQGVATNSDGLVFLAGLNPDRFQNIELDLDSVADPFLVPAHRGLTTLVHGGGVADLEFPFTFAGEIEGLVVRDDAMTRPLRNIGLELVDAAGERAATAVSEFDGYYLFQKVPPGTYTLGVVAATVPGDDYLIPPPETVVVPARGDFVQGPVFVLKRRGDEVRTLVAEAEVPAEPEAPETPAAAPSEPEPEIAGSSPSGTAAPEVAAAEPALEAVPEPETTEPEPATRTATPAAEPDVASAAPASEPSAPGTGGPASVAADLPAAPDAAAEPTVPADEYRTLHLIYELLFTSELFPQED